MVDINEKTEKKEKTGYYTRVSISSQERDSFFEVAHDVDVPYYLLMRHLARYVLNKDIDWPELLKKFKELSEAEGPRRDEAEKSKSVTMSTQLTPELYSAFTQFAEGWGSTTNAVMRRLVLLYASGKIERHVILGR